MEELRRRIIETKAREIADRWGDAVLEQLNITVPRASGALGRAMNTRTLAEWEETSDRDAPSFMGWVVTVGDPALIGAGPSDRPPSHTISAFLKIWQEKEGGKAETRKAEALARSVREERARLRRERTKALTKRQEERKSDRRADQAMDEADRRIAQIEKEIGKAKTERVRLEEWVETWETKRKIREGEQRIAAGKSYATGRKPYELTWAYRKKTAQIRLAETRKERWEARVSKQNALIEKLESRKTLWQEWIADELRERWKRLRGG